jgi:hypothetical protein
MQVFVREHCTMIAAPVQCDVDGIPKGSHSVRVPDGVDHQAAVHGLPGASPFQAQLANYLRKCRKPAPALVHRGAAAEPVPLQGKSPKLSSRFTSLRGLWRAGQGGHADCPSPVAGCHRFPSPVPVTGRRPGFPVCFQACHHCHHCHRCVAISPRVLAPLSLLHTRTYW